MLVMVAPAQPLNRFEFESCQGKSRVKRRKVLVAIFQNQPQIPTVLSIVSVGFCFAKGIRRGIMYPKNQRNTINFNRLWFIRGDNFVLAMVKLHSRYWVTHFWVKKKQNIQVSILYTNRPEKYSNLYRHWYRSTLNQVEVHIEERTLFVIHKHCIRTA